MTRERATEIARDCVYESDPVPDITEALLAAVAGEQEACAKVVEAPDAWWSAEFGEDGGIAKAIADCIRQRGRWVEPEREAVRGVR